MSHQSHLLNNKPVTVEIHKNGSSNNESKGQPFKSWRNQVEEIQKVSPKSFIENHNPQKGHKNHGLGDVAADYEDIQTSVHKERKKKIAHADNQERFRVLSTQKQPGWEETQLPISQPFSNFQQPSHYFRSSMWEKEPGSDFAYSLQQPMLKKRPFKTFYKNLKRSHVQKRQAARTANEKNYVYHQESNEEMARRRARYQIAGVDL